MTNDCFFGKSFKLTQERKLRHRQTSRKNFDFMKDIYWLFCAFPICSMRANLKQLQIIIHNAVKYYWSGHNLTTENDINPAFNYLTLRKRPGKHIRKILFSLSMHSEIFSIICKSITTLLKGSSVS
ncbi:hypothetical protein XENOCAPTIV_005201 [Xenoophorus captivus]|uniref:Maturase K n=1 Tax=Xenoophorus captivus TaxID=1517983 RepID=A0ABV0RFL7_9TELE